MNTIWTPPGWVTPDCQFVPSEPTPPVRITGESLSGHEQAAIDWIGKHRPDLVMALDNLCDEEGYETLLDTDGSDLIKTFMIEKGFVRIGPDPEEIEVEGNPSALQKEAIENHFRRERNG